MPFGWANLRAWYGSLGWRCLLSVAALALAVNGCGAGPSGDGGSAGAAPVCTSDSDPTDCCAPGQIPIFSTDDNGGEMFAGCADESGLFEDGNAGPSASKSAGEPNDTFAQAIPTIYDSQNVIQLRGSIELVGDLDVYSLGSLSAGDRITVEVEALSDFFDPSIAVFDQNRSLFLANDDLDTEAQLYDSHLTQIVRHDADPYYLVIGHSAFASPGWEIGNYRATITVEPAQPLPAPRRQVLYLNFSGGPVGPDNLLVKTLPRFEAGAIDPLYEQQDDLIRDAIIASVVENYEGFDVTVITDVDQLPQDEPHSTIMLGGRSHQAFGIAESVDFFNGDAGDVAIIFTEAFDPSKFTETPEAVDLGLAIGNIAAHEAGHLLGLNHVDDPNAIMDGAHPADTFLRDQELMVGPLSDDVLPIGNQDAPLLLSETVGLLPGHELEQPRPGPAIAGRARLKDGRPSSWCGTCNPNLAR